MLKTLVASALLFAGAQARCPSDCSGKGKCGEHDKCTCYPGYQGLDCSERTCLFGRAWGDVVHDEGLAHDYAECSGNGECDRKTGECTCFDGFTGDACRYSACPNSCSGHGTCEYISEIATDGTIQYGSSSDRAYDLWDAKKSRFCKCDAYWSGTDCSLRMCPKGNDPLTAMTPDELGGNTREVQEVQTVTIMPQLLKNTFGDYIAIGGDFTLTYTDAYNQEWTTRPIRVSTVIEEKNAASEISVVKSGSTTKIQDTQRRFNMFELYDTIEITGLDTATVGTNPTTQTITAIDCTSVENTPCALTVVPGFAASEAAAANNNLKITLVNSDTGEIGVKRMLQELPNQVVPSVTVDETITRDGNVFKITFSDPANSGDQHMLKCKVGACDSDGCQPRKKSIKGLFRYSASLVADVGSTAQITDAANGLVNFRTSAQGGSNVEIVSGISLSSSALGAGSTGAPVSVAMGAIQWSGANILVPGETGTAAWHQLDGTTQNAPADHSGTLALYQMHDFDDDSIGVVPGLEADFSHKYTATASEASDQDAYQPTKPDASFSKPYLKTGDGVSSTFVSGSFANFNVGDRIYLNCWAEHSSSAFTSQNEATEGDIAGQYKIVEIEAGALVLDRALPKYFTAVTNADAKISCIAKKIASSPCEVVETVKGTSENIECSNRGNCDGQTGLCTCFSGYTGEDCSVQTVLV